MHTCSMTKETQSFFIDDTIDGLLYTKEQPCLHFMVYVVGIRHFVQLRHGLWRPSLSVWSTWRILYDESGYYDLKVSFNIPTQKHKHTHTFTFIYVLLLIIYCICMPSGNSTVTVVVVVATLLSIALLNWHNYSTRQSESNTVPKPQGNAVLLNTVSVMFTL